MDTGTTRQTPLNVEIPQKDPELVASEARLKDAEAAADRRRADRELEDRRGDSRTVNNPRAPEAVARQHEQVDQALEKRSEENRPGHERNMERIDAEAQEAHARTQHADHHLANHVPTGKQVNRNTPRIDKDGTKHWD